MGEERKGRRVAEVRSEPMTILSKMQTANSLAESSERNTPIPKADPALKGWISEV